IPFFGQHVLIDQESLAYDAYLPLESGFCILLNESEGVTTGKKCQDHVSVLSHLSEEWFEILGSQRRPNLLNYFPAHVSESSAYSSNVFVPGRVGCAHSHCLTKTLFISPHAKQ